MCEWSTVFLLVRLKISLVVIGVVFFWCGYSGKTCAFFRAQSRIIGYSRGSLLLTMGFTYTVQHERRLMLRSAVHAYSYKSNTSISAERGEIDYFACIV